MLIQFRFKNFKSFRDDTILDLSATKITEYSNRVIQVGTEKILPVAAVFGANASGKSNVIQAFHYMTSYVLESFAYGDESEERKSRIKKPRLTPFLFDNHSRKAESSFEVYFISSEDDNCRSYNYGFTLNQDGIVEEWLNFKTKSAREYRSVFYRNGDRLDLSGISPVEQDLIKVTLGRETLVVSLGAKLRISRLKLVRDWFLRVNFSNFGCTPGSGFPLEVIPEGFAGDSAVQQKVVRYLAAFDPSIIGFNVEEMQGEEEDVKIEAVHRVIGSDSTVSIPLQDESDGTLKMFALYPLLEDTLYSGGVSFIDELNARLHPLLVRGLLILFLNPETNPRHAQLVFTTHDSWQLSNSLLRRDEIWFTQKDQTGVSTLYSLADFIDEDGTKIRKDASYEKNYLLGKYGAIPTLNGFDMFKGD